MEKLVIALCALCFFIAQGCKHDVLAVAKTSNVCDTSKMSYKTDIIPILQANCYACHSGTAFNGSGIHLDSYQTFWEKAVDEASLVPAINHLPGQAPMPYPIGTAKLDSCSINKITAWVIQGAKNN